MSDACLDAVACWHCGQPAPAASPWSAVVDFEPRTMCCPGCAAAAQAIADAGLAGYYDNRTEFAARIETKADRAALRA